MDIHTYLQEKKLITDGSFGTYYMHRYETNEMPEFSNLSYPERVLQIHRSYIHAGAKLIRTNTFADNTLSLDKDWEDVEKNIKAAIGLAKQAADEAEDVIYIAGDIGPIPFGQGISRDRVEEEYEKIMRVFLEQGIRILTFETFPDMELIGTVIDKVCGEYSETEKPFVMVQFSVNQFGYSSSGLSAKKLLREAANHNDIDAAGLNCGIGPGHMGQIYDQISRCNELYYIALPNAGYPKRIRNRVEFENNPQYFSEKLCELAGKGIDILGGCCGTNPEYIQILSKSLALTQKHSSYVPEQDKKTEIHPIWNGFIYKKYPPEPQTSAEPAGAVGAAEVVKPTGIAGAAEVAKPAGAAGAAEAVKPTGAVGVAETAIKSDMSKKLIAVELAPPVNANDEKILEAAQMLRRMNVDVVTFPDSPSGRTRVDSVLMAAKIREETGLAVMPHICCRDKNAIAMRSLILGAHINGIYNMLIMTGDPIPSLARESAKAVFNFDSVGLMKILKEMNEDVFPETPISFGGVINQGRRNLDVEINRVRKKMEAGAEFFLTQPTFCREDADRIRMIREETGARILCGIMPLISRKNALFMKNEIAGVPVTDEVICRYPEQASREEGEAVGVAIAREMMDYTEDFADGYYFSFPFNRVYLLEQIMGVK